MIFNGKKCLTILANQCLNKDIYTSWEKRLTSEIFHAMNIKMQISLSFLSFHLQVKREFSTCRGESLTAKVIESCHTSRWPDHIIFVQYMFNIWQYM